MIAGFLALFSGSTWKYVAIIAAILGLVGLYFVIKQSGADAEIAAQTQQELTNVQRGDAARADVDGLGSAAVSQQLQQFQRK